MTLLVVGLLFALLVAIFAAQNATAVTIHFLFFTLGRLSIAVVILGSALLGALLVAALVGFRQLQARRELHRTRRQVNPAPIPEPEGGPDETTTRHPQQPGGTDA